MSTTSSSLKWEFNWMKIAIYHLSNKHANPLQISMKKGISVMLTHWMYYMFFFFIFWNIFYIWIDKSSNDDVNDDNRVLLHMPCRTKAIEWRFKLFDSMHTDKHWHTYICERVCVCIHWSVFGTHICTFCTHSIVILMVLSCRQLVFFVKCSNTICVYMYRVRLPYE